MWAPSCQRAVLYRAIGPLLCPPLNSACFVILLLTPPLLVLHLLPSHLIFCSFSIASIRVLVVSSVHPWLIMWMYWSMKADMLLYELEMKCDVSYQPLTVFVFIVFLSLHFALSLFMSSFSFARSVFLLIQLPLYLSPPSLPPDFRWVHCLP